MLYIEGLDLESSISRIQQALLLCFKLQESRIAVVSSTAAATLRQLVMFVVDKMVSEDQLEDLDPTLLIEIHLPDESVKYLGPSAHDTFAIFEDLCLLANGEKPNFLHLEFLHKTFALELIESVLANYFEAFRRVSATCLCFSPSSRPSAYRIDPAPATSPLSSSPEIPF